jgi:DNA-binding transcriptional regulator LsrR (DeoR family)
MTDMGHDAAGLMTQAARLYFDRQQSKIEIATALGISRFRVARLISRALDEGLVRIEYRDAPAADRAIATAIEERYDLDLCVVAGGSDVEDVARLAASIIDGLVEPDDFVGIAWGSTMARVVAAMPARRDPSLSVVQLAGSSIRFERAEDPAEVARLLAERWGAAYHPLLAPAFVDRRSMREALSREPDVAATMALFRRLTLAVVGVGALGTGADASSLARSGTLDPTMVEALVASGVVGDLLLHPITERGTFPATELADRAMSISVDGLRAVPRVVAVAAGAAKATAIRGALRSGIVRILVTDAAAASAVVDRDEDVQPRVRAATHGRRARRSRPA